MSVIRTPLALGKLAGFLVGLAGFFTLPVFMPDTAPRLQWGVLLWYITFGAVIGTFGAARQPLDMPVRIPWWLRAVGVGAWFNFVLSLLAWDTLKTVLLSFYDYLNVDVSGPLASPLWFALEGAVIGLLIGFIVTSLGRERSGG